MITGRIGLSHVAGRAQMGFEPTSRQPTNPCAFHGEASEEGTTMEEAMRLADQMNSKITSLTLTK
jgi:hypothetical protein